MPVRNVQIITVFVPVSPIITDPIGPFPLADNERIISVEVTGDPKGKGLHAVVLIERTVKK